MKKTISILFILFMSLKGDVIEYDRQAHLFDQYFENRGCAFSNCPTYIQEKMLEETNGLYPPKYYEKDTKLYWRSYCTYLPDKCK